MWNKQQIDIGRELFLAIERGQTEIVRATCASHPWLISDYNSTGKQTWIDVAAGKENVGMMATLLDLGFNIDALRLPEESTALSKAIMRNNFEMAKFLLRRGANPSLGRSLLAAINCKDEARRMEYVRLLVEHGVDVNQLFPLYGDQDNLFTAIDIATGKPEVVNFLLSHGAKSSAELLASKRPMPPANAHEAKSAAKAAKDVIKYFGKHFGKVARKAVVENIPTGHPITIHVIRPSGKRNHFTLFTTGLSAKPMNVPEGQEQFAMAELFIQLPSDWPVEQLSDPNWNWPMSWLQQIAQYPHDTDTWLGGAFTIIANDDPPQPLAPNTSFTSLLLLAEQSFTRSDGNIVQLYRVAPLYTEERDLEIREGAPALVRAFDDNDTPFIVDLDRKNVAL